LFAGFKPERTLIFGFGHDEEVGGSKGAAHLAQLLTSRFPALDFIWDEGSGIAVGGVNPFITEPGELCGRYTYMTGHVPDHFNWDEGSGVAVGGVNPFITDPGGLSAALHLILAVTVPVVALAGN
jgi:hypothetical protein